MNSRVAKLDELTATMFDSPLRYQVESESRPHVKHLAQLDSYPRRDNPRKFNGECSCENFDFALRGLLAQGMLPEEAVARGLVQLKPGWRPSDALRCKHIIAAKIQHSDDMVAAINGATEAHGAQPRRRPEADDPAPKQDTDEEVTPF